MSKKQVRRKPHKPSPVIPMAGGLLLIGFAFLVMALPRGESNAGSPSSSVPGPVHYAAPELSLETMDGRSESLADYRGDVVLVNNWATWCPPCKAEMPTLATYYNEHKSEGFTIIAIEAGDSLDVVAQFAESYNLKFPIWLDPDQAALRAFGNSNLPNSYLIDRSGTVRYAWTGEVSQAMLEKYVTPLLTEDS
jgi:peroxiredoxin